ncbi:F-box/kelch-repeat protein At3g61590-like [Syzygium oleosum]|uniref:F-box/kelch-repeat protein At3g61590-like n=1 Tax=Syzygium oleosum TaxID=219896 RepID=UPI0024BA44FC|nr:F-box/kelch-repeat protein At3g61590-like [Syzygium oleosum]
MDGETPSADQNVPRDDKQPRVSSALCEYECNAKIPLVSMDRVLPDDLLEQILACLPSADLVRAGAVCTWWRGIITSGSFRKILLPGVSQRPWFVLDRLLGQRPCAYDPVYNVWYKLELPRFNLSSTSIATFASSSGLIPVFGTGNDGSPRLYVCNPLTRRWREIARPPSSVKYVHRTTLAISVSRTTPSYRVSLVTTNYPPGVPFGREVSVHVYDSETRMWATRTTEVLRGWTSNSESAICAGVLYFLIYSSVSPENSCGLVMYDLSGRCSDGLLASFVPFPCPLACQFLMNMKERVVLVGGLWNDEQASMKGIGIWVLSGGEWQEIARLPHDLFLGFPVSGHGLKSWGVNDLIYIINRPGSDMVIFDMSQKQWGSRNRPAEVPSRLSAGFCYEPRFEIVP